MEGSRSTLPGAPSAKPVPELWPGGMEPCQVLAWALPEWREELDLEEPESKSASPFSEHLAPQSSGTVAGWEGSDR